MFGRRVGALVASCTGAEAARGRVMGRLSKAELEALGGAFAPGYEAARAQRLNQEGLGATEADDLALALGHDGEGGVVPRGWTEHALRAVMR